MSVLDCLLLSCVLIPRSYMFGGISASGAGLGDIYVLTLPSFQWLLVSTIIFAAAAACLD